jgi:hypothetical protein
VPGSVAADAADDHARRNLALLVELAQMVALLVHEPLGG